MASIRRRISRTESTVLLRRHGDAAHTVAGDELGHQPGLDLLHELPQVGRGSGALDGRADRLLDGGEPAVQYAGVWALGLVRDELYLQPGQRVELLAQE